MKLEGYVFESLKSTLAHNTAQKRLQSKAEAQAYLKESKELLINMGIDKNQVQLIMMYARHKSKTEVEQIMDMQQRYGIKLDVSGHGGSNIKLEVLLEMMMEVASTKSEDEE